MWFIFAIKCLHIAHKTTVLHDFFLTSYVIIPAKTLGARKGSNGLGSFEQFNIFFTSNVGCFHYEQDD